MKSFQNLLDLISSEKYNQARNKTFQQHLAPEKLEFKL